MRDIDPDLRARLDSGATTMCRAWIVQRADEVRFGFTDHDRDLEIDGVTCFAGTGLTGSAVSTGTGLAVDNGEAAGALSAAGLTEDDISSGRYDHAEVWQWLVDWTNTDLRILLFRGHLGEIRRGRVGFEAELRGLSQGLNAPVGRTYTFDCPRNLGDAKCQFDLTSPGYTIITPVISVEGNRLIRIVASGLQENWFAHGEAKWLSGQNNGYRASIKADTSFDGVRTIELWAEAPLTIGINDQLELVAGCDKRPESCAAKFSNIANYRGFPHMPGEQWVAAYPADGDVHDGGSRQG